MKNQSYDTEEPTQTNAVLKSSNTEMMAQLAQINAMLNVIQTQLNSLSAASTNPTRPKRK